MRNIGLVEALLLHKLYRCNSWIGNENLMEMLLCLHAIQTRPDNLSGPGWLKKSGVFFSLDQI